MFLLLLFTRQKDHWMVTWTTHRWQFYESSGIVNKHVTSPFMFSSITRELTIGFMWYRFEMGKLFCGSSHPFWRYYICLHFLEHCLHFARPTDWKQTVQSQESARAKCPITTWFACFCFVLFFCFFLPFFCFFIYLFFPQSVPRKM